MENLDPTRFEVISADSMQVYRGMDIGTAKPEPELLKRIPHHLIDICDPSEQFHLGSFMDLADAAARDISSRGRIPVLSGGTAYYFKHFLLGLPKAPPSDPEIRRRLEEELERLGSATLHKRLERLDPPSAARIDPNDTYRVLRALEVEATSGRPLSDFRLPREPRTGLTVKVIGLERPRDELYNRINRRVERMFSQGLRQEVESLKERGYLPGDPGMRAIGYREFFSAWERDEDDDDAVRAAIQQNSRRYAKRQLTFFRSLPGAEWMAAENTRAILSAVEGFAAEMHS